MVTISAVCVSFLHMEADCANSFVGIYQKYLNTGRIDLFGTGNETRDFIHISDILRALELILGYQGPEEIFNVANG